MTIAKFVLDINNGLLIMPKRSEEANDMRPKYNHQLEFEFGPSNLKVTNEYFGTLDRISEALDENPRIVDLVHRDITKRDGKAKQGRDHTYASDTALRIIICHIFLRESLRDTVVHVDDSRYLRKFVRIYGGKMMDFSTLDDLKNRIKPRTWRKINQLLNEYAVEQGRIDGDALRMDTTASETNIHWPTDSSLLWDTYRVLARLVRAARQIDPDIGGDRRLLDKKVKRMMVWISRKTRKKTALTPAVKERYKALIELVEGILGWSGRIVDDLKRGIESHQYELMAESAASELVRQFEHFQDLGGRVVDQATRRIFKGETVPATEKILSIFEPHTEILIRGKAGKPVEFGHMVHVQQDRSKYITGYEVFLMRPNENELVDSAIEGHRDLFGHYPNELSADKAYYESMEKIRELEQKIGVVSIGKKGHKNEEEAEREADEAFRAGQRFRAGIEGTLSFLKRKLGLDRIMTKGPEHFISTVATAVFVHNLIILARGVL
ncbi:MAG: ISNCY family transposase [Planctomycetes bacterium]|nr:ISNCY family transposase [Planctomycetota bacterium]